MKLIKRILELILKPFRKLKRRWILAKAYPKLKRAYDQQLKDIAMLKKDINKFFIEFFGINAKSKYIPKDFKNNEEVRVAVLDKFGPQMDKLNLKFSDLFE